MSRHASRLVAQPVGNDQFSSRLEDAPELAQTSDPYLVVYDVVRDVEHRHHVIHMVVSRDCALPQGEHEERHVRKALRQSLHGDVGDVAPFDVESTSQQLVDHPPDTGTDIQRASAPRNVRKSFPKYYGLLAIQPNVVPGRVCGVARPTQVEVSLKPTRPVAFRFV